MSGRTKHKMGIPDLQVVEAGKMQEYPIPLGERLDSHFFMAFMFNRWLNSAFRIKAPPEIRAYGFDLFCISQNQDPVGTLPDDDTQLAFHLNLDLAVWTEIRGRSMSPLYNWSRCMCGGEVRLMHQVVTDVAMLAFKKKTQNAAALAEGRRRKRMKSLSEMIGRIGHSAMSKDAALVNRIADWLGQNVEGSWTEGLVTQALEADVNRDS